MFVGLWALSFFHGMAPGFWVPSLTNVLKAQGLEPWVAAVFMVAPICSLFSPLIGGALADERMAAQKLMGWCSLTGALAMLFAFGALDIGLGPWWFMAGLAAYALVSGEKREDCPGKIICSVTGQEICKDRCPIVTKEERPSPVGIACCGSEK